MHFTGTIVEHDNIVVVAITMQQVLHNRVSHPGVYDFADNHDGSVELPLLQHLAAADCKYTGVVVMNAIHRFPLHALPLVIPLVHRPSQQR